MTPTCTRGNCRHCNGKHHSSICGRATTGSTNRRLSGNQGQTNRQNSRNAGPIASGGNQEPLRSSSLCTSVAVPVNEDPKHVKLGRILTTTVMAFNEDRKLFEEIGVVLDTASDTSYIAESAVKKLGLKKLGEQYTAVKGVGDVEFARKNAGLFDVRMADSNGNRFAIEASCISKTIVNNASKGDLDDDDRKALKERGIALEKLQYGTTIKPEVLIGTDILPTMFAAGEVVPLANNRVILPTRFGPILFGGLGSPGRKSSITCTATTETRPVDLEKLWTMESGVEEFHGPSKTEKKSVNDKVVEQFEKDIRFSPEGYVIKLPWKTDGTKEKLPDNRPIAFKRLFATLKKYKNNEWVMEKYKETIEDQLKKGVIEEVDLNLPPTGDVVHYLSHHPVITLSEHKTTKLRIVYDGSAHHVGKPSLNSALHQGPTILPSLVGQLLRFRFGTIAIIADVEKAFLQVVIDKSDRDATRFLWLKHTAKAPTDDNIQCYRFRRVLFGVNASPFILAQTIIHHLDNCVSDESLRDEIKSNLYVDNLAVTAESLEEGLGKYFQTKRIFNELKMNLRDYSSNDQALLALIPEKDRARSTMQKVLGIPWNTLDDTLEMKCEFLPEEQITKRMILKQHAKNFDPLGFLIPLTINSKRFIQNLWKKNYTWDSPLDEEDKQAWLKLKQDLHDFRMKIPRNCRGSTKKATIVIFSDASKVAQAACAYLLTDQGCHLIFARSKIHDVTKQQTIPKVEMNAATIGARMSLTIGNELRAKSDIERVILFTDSEIALKWIRSREEPTAGAMVVNRWREIRKIEAEWKNHDVPVEIGYIRTDKNPADCASRGINKDDLGAHIWWNGPAFLRLDESNWPGENKVERLPAETSVVLALSSSIEDNPIEEADHRPLIYQMRLHALRIRFFRNLVSMANEKRKTPIPLKWIKTGKLSDDTPPDLTAEELRDSMNSIIRRHQKVFQVGNVKSRRKQLQMHLDGVGIWRCSRRIAESELDKGACEPIFIHAHSKLARAIATECHETRQEFKKHLAVEHTIAEVRRRYWIPGLRSLIQSVKRRCWECRRFSALPFRYPTSHALPSRRVRRSKPFQHLGIDYFGPLDYKNEEGTREKGYGFILTCATTRLVHLELVTNLTTTSFLLAFRRFMGRRGVPESVTSDNAATFKAGEKVLLDLAAKRSENGEVLSFMANNGICWHYITPHSPWKGAFYERLIQMVKHAFYKAVGRRILSREELETLLVEIEGVLNSRPLTYQGTDMEEEMVIRPIDFIQRGILLDLELGMTKEDDEEYLPPFERNSIRTKIQAIASIKSTWDIAESFWTTWSTKYLLNLKDTFALKQGRTTNRAPRIGELVFIVEEDLPRNAWLMGRIVTVIPGTDAQIRSVSLKLESGNIVDRPVNKLAPLEFTEEAHSAEGEVSKRDP